MTAPCPWWVVGTRRRAWDVGQLVAPLGLHLTELTPERPPRRRRGAEPCSGTTRFVGARHGRPVEIELGAGELVVRIAVATPLATFTMTAGDDGRLAPGGTAPPTVVAALETLAPSRHWSGVRVEAAGEQIVLRRAALTPVSWLHALWLCEFVADLATPPQDAPQTVQPAGALALPALALGA